jgi:hypothetical protein
MQNQSEFITNLSQKEHFCSSVHFLSYGVYLHGLKHWK